ncbi:PIG-P-domain-containing protein [Byssothecium circinans]|uniref:PIG-P-domain-containing protein n=1 Tax=Byssothecium circinans TaxID=147558 RepID=A0A6A5TKF3_9PLEO|nr:PIG-P-domain-containing protein [Byssothecium circinans]
MAPFSRGKTAPSGFQSKSTPNLPTRESLRPQHTTARPHSPTSLSEHASVEDNSEDEDQNSLDASLVPSDDSDSDDAVDAPATARPLYASRSHTHLPPRTANTLFPPFYNRPPTPLPPSPSLTSLLRPSFSTNTSRPTTPDSSDIDLPGSTRNGTSTPGSTSANLASITKSARHAPTVPRAAPKIPTYEYYGFAMYVTSSAAFLLYIVWAYVPAPMLHQMGIHYYPNRWWALAVPCWLSILVVYIYVALASYNTTVLTLPLSSCENIVDETGHVAVVDRRSGKIAPKDAVAVARRRHEDTDSKTNPLSAFQFDSSEEVDWNSFWSISTDAVLDVPIGGVCEILYGGDTE